MAISRSISKRAKNILELYEKKNQENIFFIVKENQEEIDYPDNSLVVKLTEYEIEDEK